MSIPESNTYNLSKTEKNLLIEAMCTEQSQMLKSNSEAYASERYRMLENLKVKLKVDGKARD